MSGRLIWALAAGSLFGAGLALSGMSDPARVRAFLDLSGQWDPTLAFVMAGAILPMAAAWRTAMRRQTALLGGPIDLPEAVPITGRLVVGSLLFGIGWGVAGLCPGPAIADLALRPAPASVFVLAMLAGFAIHRITFAPSVPRSATCALVRHGGLKAKAAPASDNRAEDRGERVVR